MKLNKLPIPYKYSILIGFGVGLLFALKTYLMYLYWNETKYFVFERHAVVPIVNYTLWGLLMPMAYFFISRYKVGRQSSVRENLLAILGSIFMAFFHEFTSNVIYYLPMHLTGAEPFTSEILQRILKSFPSATVSRLIEYWILYAVVTGLEFQKKYQDKQLELAQLENRLSGAQLSALRLQLQPHFLFNTLNTISSLMEINVKDAQKIVSKLGSLLRTVLDKNKRHEIELREELAFIQSYLDIEQVRFQDRMNIQYKIQENALNCLIPSLILQPLVENAVKHGFAHQTGQGNILVEARCENEILLLTVQDDGKGSARSTEELLNSGTGLHNVKERLDLLYKKDYILQINTSPGKGFSVHIRIPCNKTAS